MSRRRFVSAALVAALAVSGALAADVLPGAKSAAGIVAEGNELYKKGDFEGALKKYLEAQTLEPNAPELHFNIGDVQFGKGKFDEAAAEFRRVLQRADPKMMPSLAYNLATAAMKQGKLDKAAELYKTAIKLDPKDLEARHNLGVLLQQMEQQKQQQQDPSKQDQNQKKQDQKDQQGQEQKQDKAKQPPDQKPQDQSGQKGDKGEKKDQPAPSKPEEKKEKPPEQQQAAKPEKPDDKKKDGQQAQPPPEPGKIEGMIPREQAERLLELLKDEEKHGVFLFQQQKSGETDPEKDW